MLSQWLKLSRPNRKNRILPPLEGKKLIRIDFDFPEEFAETPGYVEVKADIENIGPETFGEKKTMVRLARFIGADPRGSPRQVDSIIMSEVLNYVDFGKTISGFSRYLKKGGRLIIFNGPKRRFIEHSLFSEKGVKSNAALKSFLIREDFELEHLNSPGEALTAYSEIRENGIEEKTIILVARKRN